MFAGNKHQKVKKSKVTTVGMIEYESSKSFNLLRAIMEKIVKINFL